MGEQEPKLSRDILDIIKYHQPTKANPLNSWTLYQSLREERGYRTKSSKELSSYIKQHLKDYPLVISIYELGALAEFIHKDVKRIVRVEKINGKVCIYLEPIKKAKT